METSCRVLSKSCEGWRLYSHTLSTCGLVHRPNPNNWGQPSKNKKNLWTDSLAQKQKNRRKNEWKLHQTLSKHIYQVMLGILVLHSWLLLSLQNRCFNQFESMWNQGKGVFWSHSFADSKDHVEMCYPEGPAVWSCHNLKPNISNFYNPSCDSKSRVDSYWRISFFTYMIIQYNTCHTSYASILYLWKSVKMLQFHIIF